MAISHSLAKISAVIPALLLLLGLYYAKNHIEDAHSRWISAMMRLRSERRQLAVAAPPQVVNEAQFLRALKALSPVIVVAKSFSLTAPLPILNRKLTIRGNPITCKKMRSMLCRIDAKKLFRHFIVGRGGELTLQRLILSRGRAQDQHGGSLLVRNGGVALLSFVTFRFNQAIGTIRGGGAIEVETGGRVRATQCGFIRNRASFGGAIAAALNSQVQVFGSVFHRNNATTAGGAVSVILNSSAAFYNAKFSRNLAAVGGAIHASGSRVTLCSPILNINNATLGLVVRGESSAVVNFCRAPLNRTDVSFEGGAVLRRNCALCPKA